MSATTVAETNRTLEITKQEMIAAPIEVVWDTLLEEMGPHSQTPDGAPLPMKIEPWPGGRWYRDLGNNAGHLWGHVQSIRPHTLLEIHGPLFMGAPAVSHVQYRLSEEAGVTTIRFSHRAIGQVPAELLDGVQAGKGWESLLSRVRSAAESRKPR
jgi:uncharacterized protein YndB with AHSA1/START domain